MKLIQRNYAVHADLAQMRALVIESRRAGSTAEMHAGDVTWGAYMHVERQPQRNCRLWFDGDALVGFAMFSPPALYDTAVHPRLHGRGDVEDEMLAWARAHSRAFAVEGQPPTRLTTTCTASDRETQAWLASRGFVATDSVLHILERDLTDLADLPSGSTDAVVRAVRDDEHAERVSIHREVWHPSKVTPDGYALTRSAPGYDPALDLVAVLPDGALAAYCICWLDEVNRIAEFEPVGARVAHRRKGYGRAVLAEGMRQMRARGMTKALVYCSDDNLTFYGSVGFRPTDRWMYFEKQVSEDNMTTNETPIERADGRASDLTFRPFRDARDFAIAAEIDTAAFEGYGIPISPSAEENENWWTHAPNGDLARDVRFADAGGATVAYGRVNWVVNDVGEQIVWGNAWLCPEWNGRGLDAKLFEWVEQTAQEIARAHPHSGPRFIQSFAFDKMTDRIALLEALGYARFRYGYMMKRDLNAPIPDLALPAGVEVRPVLREHLRDIFWARDEAFRDHFGHRASTESDCEAFLNDPHANPDWWQVAWDVKTNEVAGAVETFVFANENRRFNTRRGWTDPIFVRRPYRKQGLAKALIVRAMRVIKSLDLDEACLGVDALNPNGALKLYESLGYVADYMSYSYRKELRVGS